MIPRAAIQSILAIFVLAFSLPVLGEGVERESQSDAPRVAEIGEIPVTRLQQLATQAATYTVLVENQSESLFDTFGSGGHGSGFIVEIDPDKDLVRVFTNEHVISTGFGFAQKLKVKIFHDPVFEPETVEGKLVYVSPYYDMAIIEFPLSKLRKSADFIQKAPLADSEKPLKDPRFQRGADVVAFGNPLDGTNVIAPGYISGAWRDEEGELFFQTTAPINPGNSGGPLIDVSTGMIIGVNTLKRTDAENTGYSIPINHFIEEANAWLESGDWPVHTTNLDFQMLPSELLELEGFSRFTELIREHAPEYFDRHTDVLTVANTTPGSKLRAGDILVRVEGKIVGGEQFWLKKIVDITSRKKQSIEYDVIRKGKLIKVEQPLIKLKSLRYENFDYLYSGYTLFGEAVVPKTEGKGVQVFYTGQDSMEAQSGLMPGSLVTGLTDSQGRFHQVRNLEQLEKALSNAKTGEIVLLQTRINAMGGGGSPSLTEHGYSNAMLTSSATLVPMGVGQIHSSKNGAPSLQELAQDHRFGNVIPDSPFDSQVEAFEVAESRQCSNSLIVGPKKLPGIASIK